MSKVTHCNKCLKNKHIARYIEELDYAVCQSCYKKNMSIIEKTIMSFEGMY